MAGGHITPVSASNVTRPPPQVCLPCCPLSRHLSLDFGPTVILDAPIPRSRPCTCKDPISKSRRSRRFQTSLWGAAVRSLSAGCSAPAPRSLSVVGQEPWLHPLRGPSVKELTRRQPQRERPQGRAQGVRGHREGTQLSATLPAPGLVSLGQVLGPEGTHGLCVLRTRVLEGLGQQHRPARWPPCSEWARCREGRACPERRT